MTASKYAVVFFLSIILVACSSKSPENAQNLPDSVAVAQLSPKEAQAAMDDVTEGFIYGDGLGTAMLNTGAIVLFPPYGLFVLGNFALSSSGYEPIGVSNFLEGEEKEKWASSYSAVISTPGRVVAAASGDEYRTQERVKETLEKYSRAGQVDAVNDEY